MTGKQFKVFLVDDDEDDRFLFREAAEELDLNMKLNMFNSAFEFTTYLEKAVAEIPNLLFLDLNMPVMNGIDCLKYLNEHSILNKMFVAIYSTSNHPKYVEEAYLNGANLYIKKPTNFQGVVSVIDKTVNICRDNGNLRLEKKNFLLNF